MDQNQDRTPLSDQEVQRTHSSTTDISTLQFHPRLNLAPRYEIVKVLGAGGMGIVYKARDKELNIDVAIKVIKPEFLSDPNATERFKHELLLARQVSHKNVVRIYDLGDLGGTKYISMAYIEGKTLRDVLSAGAPLKVENAVSLFKQLCEALHAAHEVGVVHRDLKPENIILDANGTAYIMDFGIARSTQVTQGMTRTGALVGTFEYIAPEQLKGEKADQRADIFSLGVIAYEMLTGKLAHQSESLPEFITNRLSQKLQEPKELNPDIPDYLSKIIYKSLEANPDLRYQDALEIIHDLETENPSLSLTSQFKRKVKSGRKKAVAVAVMASLVLSGFAVYQRIYVRRPPVNQPAAEAEAVVKSSLVILPFVNSTGDSNYNWIRTGLPELLTTNLAQSKHIRIISTNRLSQLLKDLKISPGEPLDNKVLQQILSFFNCDTIVAGSVIKAGESFRIDVRLQKASGENFVELSTLKIDGPEGTVFKMIDSLSGQIRVKLDISNASSELVRTSEEVATKSIPAYKNYSLGLESLRQGNYRQAVLSLEKALEEDPDFESAYARLAEAYYTWGYEDKATEYYKKALAKLDKASFQDKHLIQAGYALLNNNYDEAIRMYQQVIKAYPHNEEAYFSSGLAYEKKSDYQNALAQYEKVILIEPNHPKANFSLGRNYILLRNPKNALGYLIKALALYTQLNNEQGRADALNGLGVAYEHLERFDEATRNFQESIEIKRKLGDKRGIAASLQNIARIDRQAGKYEIAEATMKQALQLYKEVGNKEGLVNTLNGLGVMYQLMGKYQEALNYYKEGLKIAKTASNPSMLAQSYENVAHIYYYLSQYEDAYVFHKQALQERKELKSTDGIIRSLQKLGDVEMEQGRYQNAIQNYLQALDMARKISYKETVAISLGQLGLVYSMLGRYHAALDSYTEALKLFEEMKSKARKAELINRLGALYQDLGDYQQAEKYLQEAYVLTREISDDELMSRLLCSMGQLSYRNRDLKAARENSQKGLEAAQKTKSKKAILSAQANLSFIEAETGDLRKALAVMESGAKAAEQIGQAELIAKFAQIKMAAYLKMKNYNQVIALGEKAKQHAENLGLKNYLYKIVSLKGEAEFALGKREAALASYQEAAQLLEGIGTEIGGEPEKSFSQRADVQHVYKEAIKLAVLLGQAETADKYQHKIQ